MNPEDENTPLRCFTKHFAAFNQLVNTSGARDLQHSLQALYGEIGQILANKDAWDVAQRT